MYINIIGLIYSKVWKNSQNKFFIAYFQRHSTFKTMLYQNISRKRGSQPEVIGPPKGLQDSNQVATSVRFISGNQLLINDDCFYKKK